MSCVLRLVGSSIDVKKFQETFGALLPANCILITKHGGINLDVGTETLARLNQQIAPALNFLQKNTTILKDILAFENVESGTLDFGIAIDLEKVVVNITNLLPPTLIKLAADIGLAIELTFYLGQNPE